MSNNIRSAFGGKNIIILLLLTLSLSFLTGCKKPSTDTVPSSMTYIGTKYVNCRLSPDFPAVAAKVTELSGLVSRPGVSRQSVLLNSVAIDNNVLYNPVTNDSFTSYSGFRAALNKHITVKGYTGDKIDGYNIFYVTDVPGWHYVCCDATLEDTGQISTPNVCHWFEK